MYQAVIIQSKAIYVSRIKETILELHPDVTVSFTFMYSARAIDDALKLRPDIIITDFPISPDVAAAWVRKINTSPFPVHLIFYAETRSFEAVKQALFCNAAAFITPNSNSEKDELHYALTRIKNQLLRQKKQKKQTRLLAKLLSSSRKQFLTDIFLGNLSGQDAIMARAKELGLGNSTEVYCPFWLKIPDYQSFSEKHWKYDKEQFLIALGNFLRTENDTFEIQNIRQTGGEIFYLAISENKNATAFINSLRLHLQSVTQEMLATLDLKVNWHIGKRFLSLSELVSHITMPLSKSEEASVRNVIGSAMYERYQNVLVSALLDKTPRLKEHLTFILRQMMQESENGTPSLLSDFCLYCAKNLAPEVLSDAEFLHTTNALRFESGSTAISTASNLLVAVCRTAKKSAPKLTNNTMDRARDYIKRNYLQNLSLEHVANYLDLNPSYFSRIFKEKTGQNFSDYLIKLRVEKAKQLLSLGKYKISEVSAMTGYKNSKYFAAQFKEATGKTPREFAKSVLLKP